VSALLAPENLPFAVSLALLGLLVIVQALGFGHFFPDPDFDTDVPDGDIGLGDGLASMVGFGRVPLLVWLASMLACFGLLGLSLQQLIAGLFGSPFPAGAASAAALLVAVPANAVVTRLLGAVWPRDETTAIPIDGLLGRRGTIAVGRASRGNPARATVHDIHGQLHNVMVEPHEDQASFGEGDEVLLVRREGEIFYALGGQGPIRLTD